MKRRDSTSEKIADALTQALPVAVDVSCKSSIAVLSIVMPPRLHAPDRTANALTILRAAISRSKLMLFPSMTIPMAPAATVATPKKAADQASSAILPLVPEKTALHPTDAPGYRVWVSDSNLRFTRISGKISAHRRMRWRPNLRTWSCMSRLSLSFRCLRDPVPHELQPGQQVSVVGCWLPPTIVPEY